MRMIVHEFWVAGVLVLLAFVAPLAMHRHDQQRRLELQQTAWVACWTHQGRKLAACERLRPAVLPEGTHAICDMTGHAPRECWELVHGGGR